MNERRKDAEVLIVGGGPAGAATAIHLARKGCQVVLLEGRDFSKPRPADMRSGEVLSPGSQQELARLGLPVGEKDWKLLPFKVLKHSWHNGRVTYDKLPGNLEFWQIDRGKFDRALCRLARENNVEYHEASRVSNLLRDDSGKVCGVVTKNGEEAGREWYAPLVVDASGRRSALLARLRLKEPEPEFQRVALVTFYQYFPDCMPGVWEQHFLAAHNTVIKGAIMREGLYRFSFETDLAFRNEFAAQFGKQTPHAMVLAMLRQIKPELYERFAAAQPLPYSVAYAPIGYRVNSVVHNNLLLVGDASGYLDPSTGQGIEFALRTARLAASSIIQAQAKGGYSTQNFKLYLEGRRREIQKSMNWLRLYLRMSRQKPLLELFSYLPPARAALMRSLVNPRPAYRY